MKNNIQNDVETLMRETEFLNNMFGSSQDMGDNVSECKEIGDVSLLPSAPDVSVIVLAYAHEKYIEECVSSIARQKTKHSFEIILAEDCSPDKTRYCCFNLQRKYPQFVRVLYSESNIGFLGNNFRAYHQSRGKYIAICEGDDAWIDDFKLETQVKCLESNPEVALVCGEALNQLEKAKFTRCPVARSTVRRLLKMNELDRIDQQRIVGTRNPVRTPTVMCRRIAYAKAMSRLESLARRIGWLPSTDFLTWIFAMEEGRLYYNSKPIAIRRVNSGSLTAIPDVKISEARRLGDCRAMIGLTDVLPAFKNDDFIRELIVKFLSRYANYSSIADVKISLAIKDVAFRYRDLLDEEINMFYKVGKKLKGGGVWQKTSFCFSRSYVGFMLRKTLLWLLRK